jgi:hypothetical protein
MPEKRLRQYIKQVLCRRGAYPEEELRQLEKDKPRCV